MIDFKLNAVGDIDFSEQSTISPFKIKFTTAKYPRLKVNFNCRTKQRNRRNSQKFRCYFYTDFDKEKNVSKLNTVQGDEEVNQSIAIRLKTELNEIQNFFNDFGSELMRIRHKDLLNKSNHGIVREYVEKAIRDIIDIEDIDISVERAIDQSESNTMGVETLQITISDATGKINYTYIF